MLQPHTHLGRHLMRPRGGGRGTPNMLAHERFLGLTVLAQCLTVLAQCTSAQQHRLSQEAHLGVDSVDDAWTVTRQQCCSTA